MDRLIHRISDAYRRHRKVAAYGVIFGIGMAVAFVFGAMFIPNTVVYAPAMNEGDKPVLSNRYLLRASEPTRLVIPKLGIDADFESSLTLAEDRTVGIPKAYDTVGWYEGSPTPGELGPSIILGHVDSYEGAAIFYHLGKLEVGDTFTVERADGSSPTFVVVQVGRYEQSDFPTDLVYGPIDHAGIRLITCSGTYDKGTLRYTHNLVVFGRLVDPRADTASSTPSN